jgi:hypothetical protein
LTQFSFLATNSLFSLGEYLLPENCPRELAPRCPNEGLGNVAHPQDSSKSDLLKLFDWFILTRKCQREKSKFSSKTEVVFLLISSRTSLDEDEMSEGIYAFHLIADFFHEHLCKIFKFKVLYQIPLVWCPVFYARFGNVIDVSIHLTKGGKAQRRLATNFSMRLTTTF